MVNGIFNFHDMSTKPQILTGHTDIVRQYLTDEERAKLAPGQLAPGAAHRGRQGPSHRRSPDRLRALRPCKH